MLPLTTQPDRAGTQDASGSLKAWDHRGITNPFCPVFFSFLTSLTLLSILLSSPTRRRLAPCLHPLRAATPPCQVHTTSCKGSNILLLLRRKESQFQVPRDKPPSNREAVEELRTEGRFPDPPFWMPSHILKQITPGIVKPYTESPEKKNRDLLKLGQLILTAYIRWNS